MVEHAFKEIEQHNTIDDCWLVINGKVYEVTEFMDDHPGGHQVLADNAGKDATKAFTDRHKHTREAEAMMKDYFIGYADMTTVPGRSSYRPQVCKPPPPGPYSESDYEYDYEPDYGPKTMHSINHALFLGLRFAIHF